MQSRPPQPTGQAAATLPIAPPTIPQPINTTETGDATGGLIPYKNLPALLAYYTAVFALIPFFPIGFGALALGIVGLRKRKRTPIIRGAIHAWIGIIMGGGLGVLWLGLTCFIIVRALK